MEVFKTLNGFGAHALHFVYDRPSHLRAIIALDSVNGGRAVGGIRNMEYASEVDAMEDACALARAMSFKAALAGLPCGGAKCVIFRHPNMKRAQAYRVLGEAIEHLGGLYHTGADVGTTPEDLAEVAKATKHVSHQLDYGASTARGVMAAIRAAVKHTLKLDSLKELRVAVQGLGEVGMDLAAMLHKAGARLVVSDLVAARAKQAKQRFGAEIARPDQILFEPCDVLAPCAIGGVISSENVLALGCRIIAGSANNTLEDSVVAGELQDNGIVYVPDYISSAGALIMGVTELVKGKKAKPELVDRVYDTTLDVLKLAARRNITPLGAAEVMAARALKKLD